MNICYKHSKLSVIDGFLRLLFLRCSHMFQSNMIEECTNDFVKIYGNPTNCNQSELTVKGKNNIIIIKNNVQLLRTRIAMVGDNNVLVIDEGSVLRGKFLLDGGAKIEIGKKTIFNFATAELEAREGKGISIGSECLFSHFRAITSDVHSVFDRQTKKRLNQPREIVIQDRVWIAYDAILLKGTSLSNDTVVGARSLVRGKYPPHVVIAGNPAEVVRSDILWDTRSLDILQI